MIRLAIMAGLGLALAGCSDRPAAPAVRREVLISVMSWHTPLGNLNGVTQWQPNGYRNIRDRDGRGVLNCRWPQTPGLPDQLAVGSPQYLDLIEQTARADLGLMAQAGFDVALYDMCPWPDWHPERPLGQKNVPLSEFISFQRWLRAARDQGIAVGIFPDGHIHSADYPKGYIFNVDEWTAALTSVLQLTAAEPALWRVEGRPAVFHFATSYTEKKSPDPAAARPDCGWGEVLRRVRAQGSSPFFLADIRPHEPERLAWDGIVDAVHCFAPASPPKFLVEMQTLMARAHRVPYVWGTSISYYRQQKCWTPPDFHRIHDVYQRAMAAGARFLHVMTWNDFNEDTDIAPSIFKGRCLLDVYAYYNRWFKDGREPDAWPEHLIIGYPRAIPATVVAPSVRWGTPEEQRRVHQPSAEDLAGNPTWGDWRMPPYHPTAVWWARLDRPRTLSIPGVGSVELPAGVSMGEMGPIGPGAVQATIAAGGQTIALPAVESVADEKSRGLQYRYHDLLHLDGREKP